MQIAQVFMTGNLGNDAETRFTNNEKSVTAFSLCVNSYQGKNKPDAKKWIRVEAWNLHDSVRNALNKGKKVTVHGQLKVNEWTSTKTGEVISEFIVSCQSTGIDMERDKSNEPRTNGQAYQKSAQPGYSQTKREDWAKTDDDIPF